MVIIITVVKAIITTDDFGIIRSVRTQNCPTITSNPLVHLRGAYQGLRNELCTYQMDDH